MEPPAAKKVMTKFIAHDDERIDYYHWLRDKSDPDVISYLKSENQYVENMMEDTKALQKQIYNEILSRIKEDDESTPYRINGYYYYNRNVKDKEYKIFCRKKGGLDGKEEVLLDSNELADGYEYFDIVLEVSPDNNILAYAIDNKGFFSFTIYFKDLRTGKLLDDVINEACTFAWANDNKTIFYINRDEWVAGNKILKYTLGANRHEPELIYEEKDNSFIFEPYKSKDRKYIFFWSSNEDTAEIRYIDTDDPKNNLITFAAREDNHRYWIEHWKNKFFILTNLDALNNKVMVTSENAIEKKYWKEFIPHRENVMIDSVEIFNNFMALKEIEDGIQNIEIIDLNTYERFFIKFEESNYTVLYRDNYEFESDKVRLYYTSLTTPLSVYDYDMKKKKLELIKEYSIPCGYDKSDYCTGRTWAKANDGTMVPISFVYKKGMRKSTGNPLLLYGYGSFGLSNEVYFDKNVMSLLDRGFVYAMAHVRGGGELGKKWHYSARLFNKMNTFEDFIACAEHMINEKFASPGEIFIEGASGGGLLVCVAANMRPELFRGVIAEVPFVDAITLLLDASIFNTPICRFEFGNPEIKEDYYYIKSFSPYDNIKKQDYPAMLLTTGLNDKNCEYWEVAKFAAKLREYKTDNNLLLLKTDLDAGHFGKSGRYEWIRRPAFKYAFILKILHST